ncbi:MAG: radical SAM protein [Proteobacteria bacterium]|nr:radical SAM protein [Pseudomonadota bacterium]
MRGAIYNLQEGRVYSINRRAVELLREYQDRPIIDLLTSNSSDNVDCREFFDRLTAMGIGGIFFNDPGVVSFENLSCPPAKLNFLWLEITSSCNNSCIHCYSSSDGHSTADRVTKERWLSVIDEASAAGARAIQLIGGEPLLVPYWRELVDEAKKHNYNSIEIFTNATLIDDDCINYFKEQGVHVATTIYAANPAVHDRVTRNKGSFDKTLAAIRKLVEAKVPTRVASIITRVNEHEVDNLRHLCKDLGVKTRIPDVVRPTGRGDNNSLLPRHYRKQPIKPPFYSSHETFSHALHYNTCLEGKIAVTPGGDVIPCIFARNQACGNILQTSLKNILSEELLQRCWKTTKDLVEKCKDCEYRYACHDCRPLAQGHSPEKAWNSQSQGCSYNPYTGEWEEDNLCQRKETK